ncbi:hypothetical protein [Streptomyces sp. AB3(2024)]|uniref:cucumopine synthase-related protein n=1 Tax=Streptomyces sp. AB3(2024) TaxID=3317321 RepID=UPI0035A2DCBD
MPTLLFVNGETRPLGYAAHGGVIRAGVADVPIESLRRMARLTVGLPAEFLGYCGPEKLWAFTQCLLSCLDRLDRDDLLGGWNLHLFPWGIGDHLRQERPAGAGPRTAWRPAAGGGRATGGTRPPT